MKAWAVSGSLIQTTLANGDGYKEIFQKAIEIPGYRGDISIAISSSGQSKNILYAFGAARAKKMLVVTFLVFIGKIFYAR